MHQHNQLQLLLHITVKSVPETSMPTKLVKYAKYSTSIYRGCMHIDIPHMKSMVSTIQQGPLYTLDTSLMKYGYHIPDRACKANIPYKHMNSKCLHICAKKQPPATSTSPYCHIYTRNKYAHKLDIYPYMSSICVDMLQMYVYIYATYGNCPVQSGTHM